MNIHTAKPIAPILLTDTSAWHLGRSVQGDALGLTLQRDCLTDGYPAFRIVLFNNRGYIPITAGCELVGHDFEAFCGEGHTVLLSNMDLREGSCDHTP